MAPRELLQKQIDSVNKSDVTTFASFYSPDAVVRDPMYPQPLRGPGEIEKDMADFLTAFPDLEVRLARIVGEPDEFAAEVSVTGTHEGPLVLPDGTVPPTHKRMEFFLTIFGALDDQGRIIDERRYYDVASILHQLGAEAVHRS